jgi:hypothetical protein
MCSLMNVQESDEIEEKIDDVLRKMWKFNQTYKIFTDQLVLNANNHRFGVETNFLK